MKFEHVIQIYWTKGFFFGGKLFYFNKNIDEVISECPGINKNFKKLLFNRFELKFYNKNNLTNRYNLISRVETDNNLSIYHPLNIILSQVNSVNNTLIDVKRLNVLRFYLIRSYRGKCHAIGKPVHGQRTWSNAWSSYNNNKTLRDFLSIIRKQVKKDDKPETFNYRAVKKKYVKKKDDNPLLRKERKKSIWF